MDKKGKKTVRYPRSKIYAKTVAAKTLIATTPPLASPSALPKPTKKESVIIDLTEERKAGGPDSYQGTPSTTSSSSDEDDFLRDESMQWEYGDIDVWKVMASDESSKESCTGEPSHP
ncbi:hypothetical protein PIB30_078338 [Stylosanthes scabra]|uniref:Uncharacterized protein n=1 Tax=Stylosanthes scabra TaxID=79078 RepID=A0ABU6WTZ6_9FABA|nr:hypothetical protein [Stylosanthes scabra]